MKTKKTTITPNLFPETTITHDKELETLRKQLRAHGFSKKATNAIVRFYGG
ncbi:MAG: hypothetical protein NWF06_02310 [Candidatus Bathyarchaeota archaeon]|nr:hypothetical protein [Candidatus Bathyarchaeum sp.]